MFTAYIAGIDALTFQLGIIAFGLVAGLSAWIGYRAGKGTVHDSFWRSWNGRR